MGSRGSLNAQNQIQIVLRWLESIKRSIETSRYHFWTFEKISPKSPKSDQAVPITTKGGGGFYPPKSCPDSDWGWCFDPPPNFEPRFFIQIMLKTKVVRWILYPYSSYFLAIFKDLEKSNRISQNTGTGVGEIHHPSIRISRRWCRWIDPPLVVIGTKKQFFANFKV